MHLSVQVSAQDAAPAQQTDAVGASRLASLLGSEQRAGFPRVTAPRAFIFPQDHGPHPAYRNEWWYVTGNLDGPGSRRFGYELTIFRFALAPQAEYRGELDSAWQTNQVYVGHFAVTDVSARSFHAAQRYSRGAAGLAGASATPFRVWLEDWHIAASGDGTTWQLFARDGNLAVDLELRPEKAPVANGVDGYSRKSAEEGNASYYYSITRLAAQGSVTTGDGIFAVEGMSWLDREWGSSALASSQVGWDWFALQLSDGRDVMFYNIRRADGTRDSHSAGTVTSSDGSPRYLAANDVAIRTTRYWQNEQGDRYPVAWELVVPSEQLELTVTPVLDDQELNTIVRYWEGAVDVAGRSATTAVSDRGYVELTGYSQ